MLRLKHRHVGKSLVTLVNNEGAEVFGLTSYFCAVRGTIDMYVASGTVITKFPKGGLGMIDSAGTWI